MKCIVRRSLSCRQKILVLDDEKEIADLVTLYLRNEGYEIYEFYDSEDAVAFMES